MTSPRPRWALAILLIPTPAFAGDPSALAALVDPAIGLATRLGGGLAILLIGWFVARMLAWLAFRALQQTTIDDRVAEALGLTAILDSATDKNRLERILAGGVFWTAMLFVAIAALKQAGLAEAAIPIERFLSTVAGALPNIAKALLILVVAWIGALAVRRMVVTALERSRLTARFAELSEAPVLADDTAQAAYWMVLVVGLAGAFDALQITAIAVPLRNGMDQVITRLPSIGVAALFLAAGWVGGRIARTLTQNLLAAFGLDDLADRAGLSVLFAGRTPGEVAGLAIQVFVVLQATIAALNQLGIRTLSEPLTRMMERFWLLLPDLAVGAVLLVVGVVVGRLARRVVTSALKGFGFDDVLRRLGFGKVDRWHASLDEPSELVGVGVQAGVSLAAVAQVLENLGLSTWAAYVNGLLAYVVQNLVVSLVILGVGFAVANVVRDVVAARSDADGQRWMGELARYAVLVFTFTMALRHLEVAEDFVLLSFGLLFGALCLAAALAFGLGSREVAADIVQRQYRSHGTPPSVVPLKADG